MIERRLAAARAWQAIERFFFAPARALPFAVLRIGLATTLLAQALQVAPQLRELYHHDGLLRGPLMDAFAPHHLPSFGALLMDLVGRGGEWLVLVGGGLLYVLGLAAMLVGWHTRLATIAVWLLHLMFMMLAPHTNYGADDFANIFLFYSIWAPCGAALSLDLRAGRVKGAPTETNRLILRVMQIHLCITYLFSGLGKASGAQWYDGEAIWRSLTAQNYQWVDFTWLAQVPWLAMIAGWSVLLVEIGYAIFVWPRRTRRIWVAAVVAMHAGIGIFMGLHVFAAVMIVLSVALFGVSAEPGSTGTKVTRPAAGDSPHSSAPPGYAR